MRLTDLFALPYPEADDLGAIALYMQNLAFNLEELLANVEDPLGEFPSRPLVYATNLADSIAIAGSATDYNSTDPDFDLTTPIFAVGDFDYASYGDNSQVPCPANRTGLWALGCSQTVLTATTPNVETWRYLGITAYGNGLGEARYYSGPRQHVDVPGSVGGIGATVWDKQQESNTAAPGVPMTVDTLAWVPPDSVPFPSPAALFTFGVDVASLGNTSSAVPIAASSLFAWAVWLGTGEETITQVGG